MTGQARYTDDLDLPEMVYGTILRSPYAHAKVVRIDPLEAKKVRGFLAILLPEDIPPRVFNCSGNPPSPLLIKDERILTDHPLYAGDRIAAIAAHTPEACMEVLDKLAIEYEVLPPVFDMEEAMSKEAPLLHSEISKTNSFKKLEVRQGDIEKGFDESDYVFESEYRTPPVQHVPLEPVCCICYYTQDEKLTVWCNTQTPFQDRRLLSELLDLPESRIRVIKAVMGGGFGERQQLHNQHVGALLSKLLGRPVKILNSREEEMMATAVRHGSLTRLKVGVDKVGCIKAFHVRVFLDAGAYCTHSLIVLGAQSRKFQYRTPNYLFEGHAVYTNGPVGGAMRGYGNPQLTFARERMMDKIARELEIDPLRFRIMNHLEIGETIPGLDFPVRSCAIKECVEGSEEIRKNIDKKEAGRKKEEGIIEAWGVAFACHTSGPSNNEGMSSCLVLFNDDGSVNLSIGSADIGQGCETTFSQIVAEELGIDLKDVAVTAGDTLHVPYDTGTFASSQIYVGGNAVLRAAQEAKEKLKTVLASQYQIDAEKVRFEKGRFLIETKEGNSESLTFHEAVRKVSFGQRGRVIAGSSSFKADVSPPPFAVCWAKVAVDKLARTIEVRHIIEAVDVGTAINPEIVRGQVEGGISMGLGQAMMEKIEIDPRAKKSSSADLLNYRIPTTLDMPEIHVYIAQGSYEPTGPFGAKSVGELPAVPVAAAIANAVSKAVNEDINELPLSKSWMPERHFRFREKMD